jgi:hypothetical protein
MPIWFTPPVVIPISLAVAIFAIAIYRIYVNSAPSPQSVAVTVSTGMGPVLRLQQRWPS